MNVYNVVLFAIGLTMANGPVSMPGADDSKKASTSVVAAGPMAANPFGPEFPPVYFCGESVPLHEDIIARRLAAALAGRAGQSRAFYRLRQRAARFFPIIEPILAYHRIPSDFKYLPLVESALQGLALSPKGAMGYWQFMPATARELGLRIGSRLDERQDLIKSTHAACRYLNFLHDRLGSWTLAAAAYNNGIGALLATIRRQQQRDYYYLRLNAETGKYLYRILAFKALFSGHRPGQIVLPTPMMASMTEPLTPESEQERDEVLLPEAEVSDATRRAVEMPIQGTQSAQTTDIPLPNAGDVFRGGIKARLVESTGVQRGQVWVFHLTRNGMTTGKNVEEGDILYAVVEDVDPKTNRLYLRADKLYSTTEKHTYNLALAAVDASTGRLGISLADIDQVKAGWLLTWKVL